eukprot:SAG11_NODE_112_length_16156_cov_22.455191_2_plen_125_part_00
MEGRRSPYDAGGHVARLAGSAHLGHRGPREADQAGRHGSCDWGEVRTGFRGGGRYGPGGGRLGHVLGWQGLSARPTGDSGSGTRGNGSGSQTAGARNGNGTAACGNGSGSRTAGARNGECVRRK